MRKFTDPDLERIYDAYLNVSQEGVDTILLRKGTSLDVAFARGYENEPLKGFHNYSKKSLCYAAYCAGKDRHKQTK